MSSPARPRGMLEQYGAALSDGVAIGRAICLHERQLKVFRFPIQEVDVEAEIRRLQKAIADTRQHLSETARQVEGDLSEELGAIFGAHELLLTDATFLSRTEEHIRERQVNAEWAVYRVVEALVQRFRNSESETLRDRVDDLQDVGRALLRSLQGTDPHSISRLAGDVILVAADLTPSEALRLGREGALAFVLEGGGRTSHTTIIARALDIPMIGGLPGITELAADNDRLIVDGTRGRVILHPEPAVLAGFQQRLDDEAAEREQAHRDPADSRTRDGVELQLLGNIDLEEEIAEAVRLRAPGVGLYRSEFLYIERSPELPTENDHLATYRRLLQGVHPHRVTVRTYDLGGRKIAEEMQAAIGDNPALGVRGIRLTLEKPEIFRSQVRALHRAAAEGDLQVLLPMVSSVEEVRLYRRLSAAVCDELELEGLEHRRDVRLGVMIEVPAAALIAEHLAREVDFFALGTNDLTQYTLAADRNNDRVADLFDSCHPAVLRLLHRAVEAATRAGIEISICGEMAADVLALPLLVGLGLRSFSVSPSSLVDVRRAMRELDGRRCEDLVKECLELASAADVRARVQTALDDILAPPSLETQA